MSGSSGFFLQSKVMLVKLTESWNYSQTVKYRVMSNYHFCHDGSSEKHDIEITQKNKQQTASEFGFPNGKVLAKTSGDCVSS